MKVIKESVEMPATNLNVTKYTDATVAPSVGQTVVEEEKESQDKMKKMWAEKSKEGEGLTPESPSTGKKIKNMYTEEKVIFDRGARMLREKSDDFSDYRAKYGIKAWDEYDDSDDDLGDMTPGENESVREAIEDRLFEPVNKNNYTSMIADSSTVGNTGVRTYTINQYVYDEDSYNDIGVLASDESELSLARDVANDLGLEFDVVPWGRNGVAGFIRIPDDVADMPIGEFYSGIGTINKMKANDVRQGKEFYFRRADKLAARDAKKRAKKESFKTLRDFVPSESARPMYERILRNRKIAQFESMMERAYPQGIRESTLNDVLTYEKKWLSESLKLTRRK